MRKGKLLSDFLEELKVYKEGALLNNTISIYCGDYSKKALITTAKLKDINIQEYQSYRAIFYDQSVYIPNYIQIYVRKYKQKVLEDNTSVPKYHFDGGTTKTPTK